MQYVRTTEREAVGRGHSRSEGFIDRNAHSLFITPVIIYMGFMAIVPFVYTLWMSLHQWYFSSPQPPLFIGLGNYYRAFFEDTRHLEAMVRTFQFTFAGVGIELILGTIFALTFNREFIGKGLVRTLFTLPMMATPIAVSMVFVIMYNPSMGVFNYFLEQMGLPAQDWLTNPRIVIPSLLAIDVWQWTPLIMLLVMAGLSALPEEPYESAKIDGANGWQQFLYLTLPLLRPTLVVAALFRAIDAFKTYDIIYSTTLGGPGTSSETLNIYIYQTGLFYFHIGYASALSIIFLALTLGMAVIANSVRRTT